MKLPSVKTALLILVTAVCTMLLTVLFIAIVSQGNLRVSSHGTIYALDYEVYGGNISFVDSKPTFDWGAIIVGDSTNRSFYLRSKSTIATRPELNTTNWKFYDGQNQPTETPSLNYLTVKWDFMDSSLAPNQEVYVTLTLTVEYNMNFVDQIINYGIKSFTFDVLIQPSIT